MALSAPDDAATAKTMVRAGAASFVSKSDETDQMIGTVLALGAKKT